MLIDKKIVRNHLVYERFPEWINPVNIFEDEVPRV